MEKYQDIFDEIYINYQPRLVAYASAFVKDRSTAKDMVQDVFISFWDKYSGLKDSEAARLLFTMTRNRCINHLQREKFLHGVDLSFLDELPEEEMMYNISFLDSADSPLIGEEVEKRIDKVMQSLPPKCRQVFTMSRFQGMKNREIAEKLGISHTAVEKHIRRAISAFTKEAGSGSSKEIKLFVLLLLMGV